MPETAPATNPTANPPRNKPKARRNAGLLHARNEDQVNQPTSAVLTAGGVAAAALTLTPRRCCCASSSSRWRRRHRMLPALVRQPHPGSPDRRARTHPDAAPLTRATEEQ